MYRGREREKKPSIQLGTDRWRKKVKLRTDRLELLREESRCAYRLAGRRASPQYSDITVWTIRYSLYDYYFPRHIYRKYCIYRL